MATDQLDEKPGTRSRDSRPLWVELEVEVGDRCILTGVDEPIFDVDAQQIGAKCKCDVVTDGDDVEVLHLEKERGDACLADLFHEFDCVPHITAVKEDALVITIHPPERVTISNLVRSLKENGYDVKTNRIIGMDSEQQEKQSSVLLDFSVLTEKEREALDLAIARGYYDEPKETTLKTLAEEELGISQSALSRRLRNAESKLLRNCLTNSDHL